MTGLSTTSALDGTGNHGFALRDLRDGERAFRRAARHSRRVRLLRVAIPIVIVLILGATTLVSWLDPLRILVRLPTEAGRLVISGTKITMEAPKLSGYTRDHRWYELTALSAAQDITQPNVIELNEVRAKVQAEDKSTMFLSATDGSFDRKGGVLTLGRNIKLRSSSGLELRLEEAIVDTATGEIVSNKPVELLTQQGTLNADRMEVSKSGDIVRFIGGVVMNLPGEAAEAAKSAMDQSASDKPSADKP
jgi:lipopolysaccharide export system protein LptC